MSVAGLSLGGIAVPRIDRSREGDDSPGDTVLSYPGALWQSVDEYDQVATAREIDTPLLFLQGDRDYQVSVGKDFQQWRSELDGAVVEDIAEWVRGL